MKRTSVLLADKHLAMVESIRDLLKTMFETVVMVSDEHSLIDALDRFHPDVVVVDLDMAVAGVKDVASMLNQHDPKIKFVVLSTNEEKEVMEKCRSSGASGCILKRSSARRLIEAMEAAQKGDTYFHLDGALRK
jgi:DNA-binding NarL/FixJ family response regulator